MANDPAFHEMFMMLRWQCALNSRDTEKMRAEVAELLRGDDPIPRDARDLLANMFDKQGHSTVVVSELKKRKGRPQENKATKIWWFVFDMTETGTPKDAAVAAAEEHFRMSRATIYDALSKIEKLLEADPENARRIQQICQSRKRG